MNLKYKSLIVLIILAILYFLIHFLENKEVFKILKSKISTETKENIKLLFPKKIQEERDFWKSLVLRSGDILEKVDISYQINPIEKLEEYRKLIIEDYILEEEQIKFSELQIIDEIPYYQKIKNHLNDTNIFKVNYYKMNHYGIYHPSKNICNKYKLIIYANGHTDFAYNHKDFLELKENALNNCYELLVLGMTGLGFNEISESSFPGQQLDQDKLSHEVFKTYFDPKFNTKKPLSLMLSGNYYLIKKIIKQKKNYDKIFMVGLSGGGWYTTFLSSIITEINSSYSIAGTMPLIFYLDPLINDGDWEQHSSSIFKTIDYVDLYLLSTLDKNFENSRQHFQIYNDEDTCCFTINASRRIKNTFNNLNIKNLNIIIWNNNSHSMLVKELMELLRKS
tara:strand:+ start:247 stop:1428 length:1182 start_codon:yes stop_codon:yes gene_type:complete